MSTSQIPLLLDQAEDLSGLLEASIARVSNVRFMPAREASPDPADKTLRQHLDGVDAIADTIESLGADDLTDDAREELSTMLLDAIAGTRQKVDNATRVLAMYEHLESAALLESARLQQRAKRCAAHKQRLEDYLVATLDASGLKKLDGETSAITIRLCPDRVVVDDELVLPAAFWREPPPPAAVPDKDAIKRAIKAGAAVAGAHLERGRKLVRS